MLGQNKNLAVVVGVLPLPGTHRGQGADMAEIAEAAASEAKMLYAAGIRNIMIQNANDQSFDHRPERMAFMSAVACAVRGSVGGDCILGVSIIPNDTAGAVAVAKAAGFHYVRAKVFVGVMIRATVEMGTVAEALNMKDKLSCDAEIWADVHDRMGTPLGTATLLEACEQAVRCGADRIILTGKNVDETLSMISQAKSAMKGIKVMAGGGVSCENLSGMLGVADGVIVATSLKRDGKIDQPLDEKRVEALMNVYRELWTKEGCQDGR